MAVFISNIYLQNFVKSICEIPENLSAILTKYQDYDGREINAVVQLENRTWSAFEVKLNPDDVDAAAANLLKVSSLFKHNPPKSLTVIVGKSGTAYRREDGVYVIPVSALKN